MSRSPEQDSDWTTGVGDSAAGESARVARLVRVAQHIEMHA
ncbi:MAG TPA: cysteine methyltransferase, partial [Marinobacter hydrocarbonoclasticus]|nr:cysteine methyltransferase [Marinobacter nauticus]